MISLYFRVGRNFYASRGGLLFGLIISYVRIYTYEKREVRLFFTLTEGFAIPVTGRKTTEVHARYANHPTHRTGEE